MNQLILNRCVPDFRATLTDDAAQGMGTESTEPNASGAENGAAK